ncbi:MAG: DUF1289 domain-containing protein [Pseudomonadota bacterium]|nr:DUF1289 domain-containing protein [Pseudomonadota bacterium]
MGCCRRRDEIRDRRTMADAKRRHLLDVVLPARGWVPVAGDAH